MPLTIPSFHQIKNRIVSLVGIGKRDPLDSCCRALLADLWEKGTGKFFNSGATYTLPRDGSLAKRCLRASWQMLTISLQIDTSISGNSFLIA